MREHSRIVFRSIFRIKVNDRRNDRLIGYVGDISEHGLKLLGDAPVEVGSELQLRLRMRNHDGQMRYAEVDVVCLWSRENPQTGYFEAGLKLQCPSVPFSELVRELRERRAARANLPS
ncbi:PilZ domain-containing protein [Zestomonas thermotolerans]|uniref:PilZ domain-containing protein n=1 Tax=Zestomonas thermotolerans TaxID=157784 RepID=UPI000375566F|nr:PilZ domain-containing protein [Pseudomonas thermotolerans]